MTYSLLPENASRLERAFERAFLSLQDEINAPFPELLNPAETPPSVLPYLAADRGVNEWDADAPTDEKRRTVATAWAAQRLGGTRKALELVVEALDMEPELIAWHEQTPRGSPFTLLIKALSRADSLSAEMQERLWKRLQHAKAERDELALRILRLVTGRINYAAASYSGTTTTLYPPIVTEMTNAHRQSYAMSVTDGGMFTLYPNIVTSLIQAHSQLFAVGVSDSDEIAIYPYSGE